eukprot:6198605-Pleurochrysis_carterae.AAC.2
MVASEHAWRYFVTQPPSPAVTGRSKGDGSYWLGGGRMWDTQALRRGIEPHGEGSTVHRIVLLVAGRARVVHSVHMHACPNSV